MNLSRTILFSTFLVFIISACEGGGDSTPEHVPVVTITESNVTRIFDGVKTEYLITTTCTDGNCIDVETSVLGKEYLVTNEFELVVQYYNEDIVDKIYFINVYLPRTDARMKNNDITGMDLPVSNVHDASYGYYIEQDNGFLYVKYATDWWGYENLGNYGYRSNRVSWCKQVGSSSDYGCFVNLRTNEMSPITYNIIGHSQINFDLDTGIYEPITHLGGPAISLYVADYIDAPEQSWTEDGLPEIFSAYLCIEATTGEVTKMGLDDVEFVPEARIICPEAKVIASP